MRRRSCGWERFRWSRTRRSSFIEIFRSVELSFTLTRAFHKRQIALQKVVVHPEYEVASAVNDIALIQLDVPLEFSTSVHPACLNHVIEDPSNDTELVVLGWGIFSAERKRKRSTSYPNLRMHPPQNGDFRMSCLKHR